MRRIGTTSGGTHIVEFTESDLSCLVKTVEGLQGAKALPAGPGLGPVAGEAAASGKSPEEPLRVAGLAGRQKRARAKAVARAVVPEVERRCIICARPLPARAKRSHVTCGTEKCKAENQKRLARDWYQKRRKAAGKAAEKAMPPRIRQAEETPVPAADKQARRELIRRLAEKKGMAVEGEAKVARDLSYVQPEE